MMNEAAEIAAMKVEIANLKSQVSDMIDKLDIVVSTLAEIRGGRKVLWTTWSVLGVIMTAIVTYLATKH